jgi:hypothetical protein
LFAGLPDTEAAAAAGVCRETLYRWKTKDPAFIAERNRRQRELWESSVSVARSMIQEALVVVRQSLTSDELTPAQKLAAAERILATFDAGAALRSWAEPGEGGVTAEEVADELERKADDARQRVARGKWIESLTGGLFGGPAGDGPLPPGAWPAVAPNAGSARAKSAQSSACSQVRGMSSQTPPGHAFANA